MSRNEDDRERVKHHLQALARSLPTLIDRVKVAAAAHDVPLPTLPDAVLERQRLTSFAAYLEHYSRADGRTRGPIDVATCLAEALALARGEIDPKAEVETRYFLPVPLVVGSPRALGQVFVSLLINASQALPAGFRADHRVEVGLETGEAGWARVTIADTGKGIAADDLPVIFEPLYSTKRGAGMGIGLAIVREIIEGMGGRIHVDSELGRGTRFVLDLPPAPGGAT